MEGDWERVEWWGKKKKDQFVQRPYHGKWTAESEVEGN